MNPGPPAPETSSPRGAITGQVGAAKALYMGYPLNELLKYLKAYLGQREPLSYTIRGNELVIRSRDPKSLLQLIELLRKLGIVAQEDSVEIEVTNELVEWLYGISEDEDGETPRSWLNYLKKFEGLTLDEAIKRARNKWEKQVLKLYLRYLYENRIISEDEFLRYKMKIKISKRRRRRYKNIPSEKVRDSLLELAKYRHHFLTYLALIYSGVRRVELWKMLKEFDGSKLYCTEEFCRYELSWIRGRKRVDFVYLPRVLMEELLKYREEIVKHREDAIEKLVTKLKKRGIDVLRTSDLRDWHYNICCDLVEYNELKINVCKLYQGRELGTSDEYYRFLVKKADEFYPKLMKRIAEELEFPPEYVNKIEFLDIDTVVINEPVEVLGYTEEDLGEEEDLPIEEERTVWEYHAEA